MINTLVIAWAATVLATCALDILAKPRVAPWHRRTARALLIHVGSATWLFVLFLLPWGRAWFALVCTVGLLGLLVAVNNAKVKALREPVVFSDLALFAQSIRHPRLYFPYLSWVQLLAVVPAIALFAMAFWFDSALNQMSTGILGLLWIVLFLFQVWLTRGMKVTLNPETDQAQHGYFCVFVTYLLNGLSLPEIRHVQAQLKASPYANISVRTSAKSGRENADAPDVVVVQCESFFDIRQTGLGIEAGLLGHFDALKRSAICAGALAVPAWGANTMRTEHAFLSGLSNAALRYARFYPYAFVTGATPAMPRAFQARGYRCTAVHPYASEFFLRHKVFPRLGFDEFVDEASFMDAAHEGPYVGDAAVTDWLIERLEEPADQPRFVFAITIENHGPFHLEKATAIEADALYRRPNGPAIDDLTVYLRHLANANKMLGRLQDFLAHRQRKTLLCFYGDHVPAMGHVYEALNANPQNSDFLIWGNHGIANQAAGASGAQCLTPEQLGLRMARIAGVL
jgi:phosphoglycerol transferase MdoB-like AlkP superfamily enzyme